LMDMALAKKAADLIASLAAQLVEAQSRERAAVMDLQAMASGVPCDVCAHKNEVPCTRKKNGECFDWRGPSGAWEGDVK
jgi:hypothetical protein